MDLFDVLLNAGVITAALVSYLIFFKQPPVKHGEYIQPGWNYHLKYLFARYYAVKRWKMEMRSRRGIKGSELPRDLQYEGWDGIRLRTASTEGAVVLLEIRKLCRHQPLAEVTVHVRLPDGTNYRLPRHPDTVVCAWTNIPDGWSAGGLKIQVLEAGNSLRILYNGLLTRDDGVTQHAQMNLIWASASDVMQYPDDWSDQLAAEALAIEPWRNGNWTDILEKWRDGGWQQWGGIQGRVQFSPKEGVEARSEYIRTRGLRERRWAPLPAGLRRSVVLTAAARDGTAVHIHAQSYKQVLTQCTYGTVRYPNTAVKSITGTSLHLPDFCEHPGSIPSVYTLNVNSPNRKLRVVIRPISDGGQLQSGVPYQQETFYRVVSVEIDGEPGYGVLELGYLPTNIKVPSVHLSPPASLRWVEASECGTVGYCLQLDSKAAACPEFVGGKGASLALLAAVQNAEGYRVPPGFCITVKALEHHLEINQHLLHAIKEIETANENYNEANFKGKCAKAVELFLNTELSVELRDDILNNLNDLRKQAAREDLGPERCFAVRSSAVGEDSETLSAAGQNETILGCVSDNDVIKAVQKCWASMFAFTSAYYRRQNGQACICGGGIVVQALVSARAAGVMFTRHPNNGDPTKILITANYGLGESVVSGSAEPDTIIISRSLDDSLAISKIEVGSKLTRVTTAEGGVGTVEVPEGARRVACVSETEAMHLARIALAQELLWAAPRDIEWAIRKNEIYLLQARPITSLERWSSEELLHELDTPIMADDELTTFANCGEVFPKPMTPLTHDLVFEPVVKGMDKTVSKDMGNYEHAMFMTHNRCTIALYNLVYYRAPLKLDIRVRMSEMAIHGHKVADEEIIRTAVRRRPPKWNSKLTLISFLLKTILSSKWCMNDTIKRVKEIQVETETEDPLEIVDGIMQWKQMMGRLANNHSIVSSASTSSQIIAMAVLLEDNTEFTPEHCNEICAMLSSGDVLSAEVPLGLAKLTQEIEESGKAELFRKQDPKEAMNWLRKNLPHVHLDVCVFLEQHGYRAIMEFDMYTKPWILVPEELMKILQNLRGSNQEAPIARTDAEIISSLTTPRKARTGKILAWVLPLCRRTVRHRECTKAHLILAIHKLRLATIELGKLMVRKWYLPDYELVFFFRCFELKEFIQTRNPALLRKAIQRQQCFPNWCKLKFSELNTGWVQPLETKVPQVLAGSVRLEATSVGGGEAIARACVVKDLSEIDQLQQGDILITYATDIGWSPYFPLLSGIVTELGGLISHGAVIAREYGLPCIVGATHATDMFRTGDIVRLVAATGVIEKVEVVEETKEQNGDFVVINDDKQQTAD
ncbi:hypothetical protein evm_000950 [Chilo suppressalis]|nr:hypothetical protein evm_000950 [Chilo suppressalis]